MVVFTRKFPIQRLLKKRWFISNKRPSLRYGTAGIYCLSTFRFEYRYGLFLRKFFKRSFRKKKRKNLFFRRRIWLFIRPNYVLTHKSKNARMGKGKGNFKRWCTIIYPGRPFIEHLNVTPRLYLRYIKKLSYKLKLKLYLIHHTQVQIKNLNINSGSLKTPNTVTYFKIKRALYKPQKIFQKLLLYYTQ